MSARPAPRKSSLAGSSPIAPPAPAPAQSEPRTEDRTSAAAEPAGTVRTRSPENQPKSKYPPKVSFYQDPEDTDRMRAALLHTLLPEGKRSLSQFIHTAVRAEVERLERKYNNGRPFPPVGARGIPQGRPMGE